MAETRRTVTVDDTEISVLTNADGAPQLLLLHGTFWSRVWAGMLPAFGSFTGNHPMRPQAGERVFGIGGGMVIEMPVVSRARARH